MPFDVKKKHVARQIKKRDWIFFQLQQEIWQTQLKIYQSSRLVRTRDVRVKHDALLKSFLNLLINQNPDTKEQKPDFNHSRISVHKRHMEIRKWSRRLSHSPGWCYTYDVQLLFYVYASLNSFFVTAKWSISNLVSAASRRGGREEKFLKLTIRVHCPNMIVGRNEGPVFLCVRPTSVRLCFRSNFMKTSRGVIRQCFLCWRDIECSCVLLESLIGDGSMSQISSTRLVLSAWPKRILATTTAATERYKNFICNSNFQLEASLQVGSCFSRHILNGLDLSHGSIDFLVS